MCTHTQETLWKNYYLCLITCWIPLLEFAFDYTVRIMHVAERICRADSTAGDEHKSQKRERVLFERVQVDKVSQ